jgi:uncharacterized membrane protein YfcA
VIDDLPGLTVALLCLVAFAAGWIDSVVGGGGVIQLPSLLIGLPPDTAVATVSGTNKLSSVAGTAVAAGTYLSRVAIHWPTALVATGSAFAGSSLGARLVQFLPRAGFAPIIVVIVAVVGVYTWRRPTLGQATALKHTGAAHWGLAAGLGLLVGVYDGLVGPGTGVFLVVGFVALLGYGFLQATAMAKLANLATNLAALIVLGAAGHVLWALGGCMAACNLVGGAIGSRMALRYGNQFIRIVFLVAVAVVEVKLVYDTVRLFV